MRNVYMELSSPDLTGTYDDGTKIRYKNFKNLFDSVENKKP